MVIFCLMRRLILRTNYLSKKMLNDIENKVLDLHEKFKEKFGVNKYENLVGANLYFNNIYEKSIVSSLNIDGKSEQETRSGKNLYNSATITAVSNGTNNNGVITSNTFSTNYLNLAPYNIVNLEAGTYYLSADIRIISGTPTINKINDYISDAEVVSKPTLSTTKQRYVYKKTYTSATRLTRMLFQFNASANAVVEVSNIMISKENTSYEPYGASPSPDYPSEIKTVKGVRNLWGKEEHGSIDESTGENIYNQNRWRMIDFVEVEGDTDYTLSTKSNTSNIYYIFYYYDKNYNFISSKALINKTSATNKTPSNCKYMKCVIADTSSIKTSERKLEKGSVSHDYVPYGSWLKVKDTGKNLNKYPYKDTTVTRSGITYKDNGDGTININGTATATAYFNMTTNNSDEPIKLKAGTYTASLGAKSNVRATIANYYNNKQVVASILASRDKTTFTINEDMALTFVLAVNSGLSVNNVLIKPQLEQGSTATEYEPYQEQSTLIDMNKPNLFDKDNANILNDYFDASTTSITYSDTNRTLYIPCKENTTYTISKYLTRVFNIGYTTSIPVSGVSVNGILSGTTGNYNGTKTSMSITTGANAKYLVVRFIQTALDTTVTEQQMLDSIKIYEGFGDKDYYELSSIGDTKDELNIDKDGNVSIKQNIGEVVLNGSENWAKNGNETVYYCTSNILGNIKQQLNNDTAPYLISTHFRTVAPSQMWTNPTNDLTITSFISKNNEPRIRYNAISTVDNFKTWLSTHPVTVKYILDKPQTISLGKITPLKLLEGTNNITTNDELQPNMTSSINCLNLVETSLRNIKVNDYLNNKTIHLSFPFESYESITSELPFVSLDDEKFLCRKVSSDGNQYIGYKYKGHYNFLYYKYTNKKSILYNYIRYKLPNDYGKVSSINENDIFYKFVKIKDDEYKLQEYNKKTWVDNEIPYLQYIDNIEEGINNVAEILYKPLGYEYKKWTTTGYYGIKSNDYGLAQKPISNKDFDRWDRNIHLLENIIDSEINIWNIVSYTNWNESSKFEWEEY